MHAPNSHAGKLNRLRNAARLEESDEACRTEQRQRSINHVGFPLNATEWKRSRWSIKIHDLENTTSIHMKQETADSRVAYFNTRLQFSRTGRAD